MTDTKYNGWTNYETWLVNLWLDNDGASEYLRERCAETYEFSQDFDESDFADVIRDYVAEAYEIPTSGMLADIVNAALSSVDWREIASHYRDDLPELEEEENEVPVL